MWHGYYCTYYTDSRFVLNVMVWNIGGSHVFTYDLYENGK